MKKRVMMKKTRGMIGVHGCLLFVRLELETHKMQPLLMNSVRTRVFQRL